MIKVIDSIMGSGKTSYIIQEINNNPGKRFIYITPFLTEVKKIKTECKDFYEPEAIDEERKLDSLNKLLMEGKNITTTHALFKRVNSETIQALRKWNYILYMDETMELVSNDEFMKDDLPTIIGAGLAHIDEQTGYLVWDKIDYNGAFNRVKRLCQSTSVVVVDGRALVWVFPVAVFSYFQEVYICTYMFDAQIQRFYFDMHKVHYQYYRVELQNNQHILIPSVPGYQYNTSQIPIKVYTGKKNDIGSFVDGKVKPTVLSKRWYNKASKADIQRLKKNMVGYFKNDLRNSPSSNNLWTAFINNQKDLQASPYTKGFLACNTRALNDYRGKTAIAYMINKFINPYVLKYFAYNGISITLAQQERYALAELLQFIFRSAIRDGKEVNLYIPSIRMRHLLQDWLGLPKAD